MKLEQILTIGALFLLIAVGSVGEGIQPVTQIEIILDASGSMWGEIDSKSKIRIAKEAINTIVDQLVQNGNIYLGLRVYGHLSTRCDNSVLEVPIMRIDPELIKSKIDNIYPIGNTPIAFSLKQAVYDFRRDLPGNRAIILITDGYESCQGDPCSAVSRLTAAGIEAKTHVLGLGLDEVSLEALSCIVSPTQGRLMTVENSEDLIETFTDIAKEAETTPPLPALPIENNLEIMGKDYDGRDVKIKYQVYEVKGTNRKAVASGDNLFRSLMRHTLPAGMYEIRIENIETGSEILLTDILLSATERTYKTGYFAERKIRLTLKNSRAEGIAGEIFLYDRRSKEGKNTAAPPGEWVVFTVIPGIYDIKIITGEDSKETWLRDIDLTARNDFNKTVFIE